MESISLVVVCIDCMTRDPGRQHEGVLMRAVKGNYAGPAGFVFECPKCKRKVGLAYVEERFAEKIEIVPSVVRRKRKTSKYF